MRKALAMVLVCLGLVVAAPRPAHAMLGIDFMEWLNDMSGPGPFHVFGVEATVACWGKVVKLDKQRVESISPALAEAVRRIRALETAEKAADPGAAREPSGRLPPDDFRRLLDAQRTLGLEIDQPIVYFNQDGDIATTSPVDGPFFGLSPLKSIGTGAFAFACNQPRSNDLSYVVDLHRPVFMLGVSVNYLFTPINHLQYEGGQPGDDTPNVHALLYLGTVDLEFKRFISVGYGFGSVAFHGGDTYQSFNKAAHQFRIGFRPLKHLDLGSRPAADADRVTHATAVERVAHQGALKKLSTLRFVFGYTFIPGADFSAAKFGAVPSSWPGTHNEHIMTANFTFDISRTRKPKAERAIY